MVFTMTSQCHQCASVMYIEGVGLIIALLTSRVELAMLIVFKYINKTILKSGISLHGQ